MLTIEQVLSSLKILLQDDNVSEDVKASIQLRVAEIEEIINNRS